MNHKYTYNTEVRQPHEVEIPCLSKDQKQSLVEAAHQTALRFCSPIYLVGSALESEYPNDIDLYIAVPGHTYLRLFTNYNRSTESSDDHYINSQRMQIQQARIYQKQKQYFESKVKGWDFDIKFQNHDQFVKHEGKRLRLDFIYEGVW
jgi:hypothetical protein